MESESKVLPKSADRIDKIIADINNGLGGGGFVYRSSKVRQQTFHRRSSGIPSIDYIMAGGPPKGGIIEIGGQYSTGKTTIAMHIAARAQRMEPGKAIGWVAIEPFSKRWARSNGLFIPFSEDLVVDPVTGEEVKLDSFDDATELEKYRMKEAGIEDPYAEICPFVLVQDSRGDVALDAALKMVRSNQFSVVVVDSLGVAKSTSWVEEKDVQDSGDFPREARMIGDYTTRALLALNLRYDTNGEVMNKGEYTNETTLININHVGVAIGTQAKAPWNVYQIKGGEGNKHNHHFIMFLWKGQAMSTDMPNVGKYTYGTTVKCIGIKSKIGPPWLQSEYDFYFQDYASFRAGDIDTAKDAATLGIMAGIIERSGAWYTLEGERFQGLENLYQYLRDNPDWKDWVAETAILKLRQ